MNKKLNTLLAAILLIAVLAACAPQAAPVEAPEVGQDNPAQEEIAPEESDGAAAPAEEAALSGEPAPAEEAASPANPPRVAFLITQAFGAPFEVDIWDHINKAQADGLASEVKMIEMKEPSEYEQTIRRVSEEGYDLIVSTFFFVKEPMQKVAPDFPEINYVIVNDTAPEPAADYPNMKGVVYDEQEGSYVCGVVSALLAESNRVGFIGGSDDAGIRRFLAGYEAGLKSVKPDITIDVAFAGTFIDPEKGRELALALYERGDEVIMHAANKTGLGVFIAGTEVGKYAVGVDVDQSPEAPETVVCSALSNPGSSVYETIRQAATGSWSGGTAYWGVDDGVTAASLNEALLTPEIIEAAQEAELKLASGEVVVPVETELK